LRMTSSVPTSGSAGSLLSGTDSCPSSGSALSTSTVKEEVKAMPFLDLPSPHPYSLPPHSLLSSGPKLTFCLGPKIDIDEKKFDGLIRAVNLLKLEKLTLAIGKWAPWKQSVMSTLMCLRGYDLTSLLTSSKYQRRLAPSPPQFVQLLIGVYSALLSALPEVLRQTVTGKDKIKCTDLECTLEATSLSGESDEVRQTPLSCTPPPKTIWKMLLDRFETQNATRAGFLMNFLHNLKMEGEWKDFPVYQSKLEETMVELTNLGESYTERSKIHHLVLGLPSHGDWEKTKEEANDEITRGKITKYQDLVDKCMGVHNGMRWKPTQPKPIRLPVHAVTVASIDSESKSPEDPCFIHKGSGHSNQQCKTQARRSSKKKGRPANPEKAKGKEGQSERSKETCKKCGKVGHNESKCWKVHPELRTQYLKSRGLITEEQASARTEKQSATIESVSSHVPEAARVMMQSFDTESIEVVLDARSQAHGTENGRIPVLTHCSTTCSQRHKPDDRVKPSKEKKPDIGAQALSPASGTGIGLFLRVKLRQGKPNTCPSLS